MPTGFGDNMALGKKGVEKKRYNTIDVDWDLAIYDFLKSYLMPYFSALCNISVFRSSKKYIVLIPSQ